MTVSASAPPSCLLVEDSPDDAYFFQRTLKKTGSACSLKQVPDGGAAIQFLHEAQAGGADAQLPHIIFLDLKMPVMSGFDVLSWIQRQGFSPPLYVIVLSGSDHKADVARAQELGASDYMVKPISVQDLKDRLERAVPSLPRTSRPGSPESAETERNP